MQNLLLRDCSHCNAMSGIPEKSFGRLNGQIESGRSWFKVDGPNFDSKRPKVDKRG